MIVVDAMLCTNRIAQVSTILLLMGCGKQPERAAPSDITFTHLEVRQIRDVAQPPPEPSTGWTVVAGREFYVVGAIMKSELVKTFSGACFVKVRALRGNQFATRKTSSAPIESQDDNIGRYEAQLEAPKEPGIYFLAVNYGGHLIGEAVIRATKADD